MSKIKTLYSGRYLELVERDNWEYVIRKHHKVAIILPVLDNGDIVLISEFRQPLQKRVIGLPAGLVGDHEGNEDENIAVGALREMEEEVGYTGTLECVLKDSPSSSGMTDEVFSMFIAKDLTKIGPGGGDKTEDIKIMVMSPDEFANKVPEWIESGYVIDPKIYIGLHFLSFK